MNGQKHNISGASGLFYGAARFVRALSRFGRPGYPVNLPSVALLGAVAAIANGALVAAATGAELPNNATKNYTTANSGVSPIDSGSLPAPVNFQVANGSLQNVWPLATPRNVSMTVTHGSSIVAMSLLVSGYDVYGIPISELLSVTATGTSKTATGKKAFAYISSYAFSSSGDATANTANVQWGNTLGLDCRITDPNAAIVMANGVPDATATVTVADDSVAGTTTGDARGTVLSSVATDGTKKYGVWYIPADAANSGTLFGNAAGVLNPTT